MRLFLDELFELFVEDVKLLNHLAISFLFSFLFAVFPEEVLEVLERGVVFEVIEAILDIRRCTCRAEELKRSGKYMLNHSPISELI